MKKNGVIVLGGHIQGYGIVRVFGENNIPSIVIDHSKLNIARHSKYCIAFYKSDYKSLLELLFVLAQDDELKNWLIIPTDDYYVRIISQNRYELSKYYIVTVDEWKNVELFFDKSKSYPLVKDCEIPIPETYYPRTFEELSDISTKIQYPCIIKPAIMLDFYRHFKKKVFICNDQIELNNNFKIASKIININQLLIQEIIPGDNDNQYSVGILFNRDKSYNYLICRRKRQHPIDFGNATTFAETVNIPLLVEYAHKILTKAKYWGICEVEFKYDHRSGQYKFLEVNPRSWKWHLISESAKIPFLISFYEYLVNGEAMIKKDYIDAGWRDLITDIPVIVQLIFRGHFIKSKINNISNAVYCRYDIKPFVFQLLYSPFYLFSR